MTNSTNFVSGTKITKEWLNDVDSAVFDGTTIYTPSGTGAVTRTVTSKLNDWVSVKDFGATGDGTTDDTAALQAALTYAGTNGYVCRIPPGRYKTTSGLSYSGTGGIDMESCGYGAGSDTGIFPVGSGYTALTIGGSPKICNITLGGAGQTLNGVLIQNPSIAHFGKIRTYSFVGFGVKINKCWDCLFDMVSVELCGTTSEYAFSMNDDGDTCNMTNILRLQVEQANGGAILVSPNTLSCHIQSIHSERATPSVLLDTWVLGGNRCTYTNTRFNSSGVPANSKVLLVGNNNTYTNLLSDTGVPVVWDASSVNSLTLVTPEILGTLTAKGGTVGTINILGGSIASIVGSLVKYRQYNQGPTNFTPTLIGTTTAGTGTYTTQTGVYQLVGGIVTFTIALVWTAHTGTGNIRLTGLPKVSAGAANYPVGAVVSENLTYTGTLGAYIPASDVIIELKGYASNVAGASITMDTTGSLFLTGSYAVG